MRYSNPWATLGCDPGYGSSAGWLEALVGRNAHTRYLQRFGSPLTLKAFRTRVPVCTYADLLPELRRIASGEHDVLFAGRPVAYERTGGSAGGSKVIPYSMEGLRDFQRCVLPWLAHTVRRHRITGRAYFSISPAAREPESIAGIPVGLPDGAYLGEAAARVVSERSAVPASVGTHCDVASWRRDTLSYLLAAEDLELISVWSPTFLVRLLEGISDTAARWPRLKVVSCWASGPARRYVDDVRRMFPRAAIEPKGLLSTEAVVTVPNERLQPVVVRSGFVEFQDERGVWLDSELQRGNEYGVVVTTASGLYRYATGDRVRYEGHSETGQAIVEFIGRDALTSDLVGEKLTESFVSRCLEPIGGFAMLVPDHDRPGYVLVCERPQNAQALARLEDRLGRNPQYAYARKLGQLAPLRALVHPQPFRMLEQLMRERGVRLGDIKPTALRGETFWLAAFEGSTA